MNQQVDPHFSPMLRATASRSVKPLLGNARSIVTAKLPDLPYDFGALQPVISGEIMQVRPRISILLTP